MLLPSCVWLKPPLIGVYALQPSARSSCPAGATTRADALFTMRGSSSTAYEISVTPRSKTAGLGNGCTMAHSSFPAPPYRCAWPNETLFTPAGNETGAFCE